MLVCQIHKALVMIGKTRARDNFALIKRYRIFPNIVGWLCSRASSYFFATVHLTSATQNVPSRFLCADAQ